jgi:NhaP-type Na+/H+ or K+/H+ antiporter
MQADTPVGAVLARRQPESDSLVTMAAFWFLLVGVLLISIGVLGRFLDRLPVSPAMIYLLVGVVLGPMVFGALELHPTRELELLTTITEVAVLIALFTVGVKARVPMRDCRWRLPLRLATVSMLVTIVGVAAAAFWLLDLPLGLALILGAALAPTDPVLASDVQLRSPDDRDSLRFALTGEGGLNDGTAFPFVFLGLGLLGLHEIGELGWRWFTVDLLWSVSGGIGVGLLVGTGVARGVRRLRAWRNDAVMLDEFLLLGVIGFSYGAALLTHTLGFLAVFAAGLALRREDDLDAARHRSDDQSPLTPSMLNVNEQLERIVEVAIVLLVGAMISTGYWSKAGLAIAALLFVVIRPLSVWLVTAADSASTAPRRLLGWFGIRGIGSVYYALFAAGHELAFEQAETLLSCVFTVVGASILVHGISATPLMEQHYRRTRGRRSRPMSDKP